MIAALIIGSAIGAFLTIVLWFHWFVEGRINVHGKPTICQCHTPLRHAVWFLFERMLTGRLRYWFGRFVGLSLILGLGGCVWTYCPQLNECRDKIGRFVQCPVKKEPVGADWDGMYFRCRDVNGITWLSRGECD